MPGSSHETRPCRTGTDAFVWIEPDAPSVNLGPCTSYLELTTFSHDDPSPLARRAPTAWLPSWCREATADAVLLQHQILAMRLRRAKTVIVDNTSVQQLHRLQLVELAHQYGRRALAAWVDAPLPTCLARNAARADHERVPEDVVRWQHAMSRSARHSLSGEGFDEIRHHRTA
ncbi:AAA family ATPase [Kitasatospora purpeofusca]|uniref:AAA family ATPase n=1 Tax=Kitasatospora purpeofusca TaxID=67352 RepID=UPI00364C3D2E